MKINEATRLKITIILICVITIMLTLLYRAVFGADYIKTVIEHILRLR